MTFYNTIPIEGKELKKANEKARTQDEIIKGIILKNYCSELGNKPFSPKAIYQKFPIMNTPITSIRRSLDKLKKEGFIEETGNLVMGIYSKKERELIKV